MTSGEERTIETELMLLLHFHLRFVFIDQSLHLFSSSNRFDVEGIRLRARVQFDYTLLEQISLHSLLSERCTDILHVAKEIQKFLGRHHDILHRLFVVVLHVPSAADIRTDEGLRSLTSA